MMILVGGEKGGSGKSCLAQNIAVYLRCEKKASVLMHLLGITQGFKKKIPSASIIPCSFSFVLFPT